MWYRMKNHQPSSLSFVDSSLESSIHLYACIRTAGPRYLSAFHQYDGQEVEQHAHRMHWQFQKCIVSVRNWFVSNNTWKFWNTISRHFS